MSILRTIKKTFIKGVRYSLPQKQIETSAFKYVLETKSKNIEYTIRSNIVLKIKSDNEFIYFRHCFPQLPLKKYVNYLIGYYFKYLAKRDDINANLKSIVSNELSIKANYRKFIKMGCWKNNNDPSGKYILENAKSSIIGISLDNASNNKIIKEFAKFASVMLENWKMNNWFGNKNGDIQLYHANIEFAYHSVASIFDADKLLPSIWFGFLSIEGDIYFGYFMREAKGIVANSYSKSQRLLMVSPFLQMCLNNVFVIDYICGVYDHAPYNYSILIGENGCVQSINFFDNNEGGAFPIFRSVPKHVRPLVINGVYARPFLDKNIANRISSIEKEELFDKIEIYLSRIRMIFCWRRIMILKRILRKNNLTPQIIGLDQWNSDTIAKELSGDYGKTYLNLFLEVGE